jgi:hypothetical protein
LRSVEAGTTDAVNPIGSWNHAKEVVMATRRHASWVIATLAAAVFLGVRPVPAWLAPDTVDALVKFTMRVDTYVQLHQRLEASFPPVEDTRQSLSRLLNKRYLASALRSARRHVKEGNIFGPPVEEMIRTRIAEAMAGRDLAVVVGPCGGESWGPADLVLNEPLSEGASCPVPVLLLEALPPVPGGLEYRIVGPDLVLWDVHAEIVIDVLRGAFRVPSLV